MAEILNIPTEVWESNWKDDVDVDYAIYGNNEKQEAAYIAPEEISNESIEMIKSMDLRQKFRNRTLKLKGEFEAKVA